MNFSTARQCGSWLGNQRARLGERFRSLVRQMRVMTLILKHPGVTWPAKLVAGCTVGYVLSPIQLIPSFIPIIGQLDDLAVLLAGSKLLRVLAPAAVLAECELQAESPVFYARPPQPKEPKYRQEPALSTSPPPPQ